MRRLMVAAISALAMAALVPVAHAQTEGSVPPIGPVPPDHQAPDSDPDPDQCRIRYFQGSAICVIQSDAASKVIFTNRHSMALPTPEGYYGELHVQVTNRRTGEVIYSNSSSRSEDLSWTPEPPDGGDVINLLTGVVSWHPLPTVGGATAGLSLGEMGPQEVVCSVTGENVVGDFFCGLSPHEEITDQLPGIPH